MADGRIPPVATREDAWSEYAATDAWSCSDVEDLILSPRRLIQRKRGIIEPRKGPALDFGAYLHMRILEPHKIEDCVVIGPVNEKTGKCYGRKTKAWSDFAAEHEGKIIIDHDDIALADAICKGLLEGDNFSALYLGLEGPVEQSIYWTDPDTGLRLRIRPDKRVMTRFALDLKTSCNSVRPFSFAYTCAKYRYDLRAAFYRRGIRALTGEEGQIVYIALPKEPPFEDVAWHEIHPDDVDLADEQLSRLLEDLARRIEHDDWAPVWAKQPNLIRLPGRASAEMQWEAEESEDNGT